MEYINSTKTILLILIQVIIILIILFFLAIYILTPQRRQPFPIESEYNHPITRKKCKHPSLFPSSQIYELVTTSLVVPAYNEKDRIPNMLDEALLYFRERKKRDHGYTFEIIVVDDGSSDGTTLVVEEWARTNKCDECRVVTFVKNRGKGGAVTQGMFTATGEWILFADADAATKFSDLDKLELETKKIMRDGFGVGVGSRAHMVNTEAVVKRSPIRNFLMHCFHTTLLILGISYIQDTQCGFKLFSRLAAQSIIPNMHVEGFIFDIEMLLLANWNNIPIVEVPISWHEVAGTKMNLVVDSLKMAKDLLVIRTNYAVGFWTMGTFVHSVGDGIASSAGNRSSNHSNTRRRKLKSDE